MHPTSLPGPYGVGELGSAAYAFLDYLAAAGQTLWQVLPLGPTGYGDSPYACFSSFAGNPLLVSVETLVDSGVLERRDLAGARHPAGSRVDFGSLIEWKMPLLRRAAARFLDSADAGQKESLGSFTARESWWLEDYALFMAIKGKLGADRGAWNNGWPAEMALRNPKAMVRLKIELERRVQEEKVIQFFFFMQWDALHAAASRKGIRIIGDLPIFAAPDSADVWANRESFSWTATAGRPSSPVCAA